ncbi:hypothetical protein BH18ACT4_BH18ACT4_03620 [soil metagenome]
MLALVIVPLVALVVAAYVGDALTTTLADTHPLLLLTLNARIRVLVLVTNDLDPVSYYVVGFLRLLVADPLFYLLGVFYGDAAIRWVERKSPTYGPMLRSAESFFGKAAYPLVLIAPNTYICLFAGAAGMGLATFFALNIVGTIGRLYLIRRVGEAFESPIDGVLDFFQEYRVPLFVLSVVLVVFSIWSERRRKGESEIEALAHLDEELTGADDEVSEALERDE